MAFMRSILFRQLNLRRPTPRLFSTEQQFSSKNEEDAWNEVENAMFHNKPQKAPSLTQIRNNKKSQSNKSNFAKEATRKKEQISKKAPPEVIKDPEIGEYLNLDRDDPLLEKLMLSVLSKKHREKDQILMLEGRRLVEEALKAGLTLKKLIFSKMEQVKLIQKELAEVSGNPQLIKIPNHNLKFWSQLTTSPGIMGIFERPVDMNALIEQRNKNSLPITLICDNVREPNNLGSIIRVCAAAGIEQVILTKGCTAPWEPKALRGSSGAHFRIKIIGPIDWQQISHVIGKNCDIFVAQNQSTEQVIDGINYENIQVDNDDKMKVLIVGGESHGISEDAKEFVKQWQPSTGKFVQIPLASFVDSLNVCSATSVILFELRRKLLEKIKAKN